MEAKGRFFDWRFSPVEMIGFGFSIATVAVSITLWSVSTFQSKQDAIEVRQQIERRIDAIESQVNTMRQSLENVARDTSYIRGRLEPKSQ